MRRKIKYITLIVISILIVYWTYRYLTVNGRVIPIKISVSWPHPTKSGYNVFDFKEYIIELPIGWKDKGFRYEELFSWTGKLKSDKTVFHYGYCRCSWQETEKLQVFLYKSRYDEMIMGDTVIISRTDSTYSVRFVWPIDPETSDTLKTGILNDSLKKLHPPPNQLYYNCNYYSITEYNDSIYFIPIKVPEIVYNSKIDNAILDDHKYNIVRPIKTGIGITLVNVMRKPYTSFSIWGYDLDYATQEELIKAGLSVKFDEIEFKFRQGSN